MPKKILIAGDGGQGVQTISEIIGQAAFQSNYFVSVIPNYGLEQRGGVSLAYVQISKDKIVYPKFQVPNILVIMSEQADLRTKVYQKKGVDVVRLDKYKKILEDEKVSVGSLNLFVLGILVKKLAESGLNEKVVEQVLKNKLEKKPNWSENLKAFKIGLTA